MPKDVPKDMPRDAMQREAVPKDAVPREAMPKDSAMKGGRGSPTRAPPRRQRPRNQPIRRPCTWSLPRDCHSQSGERRQGSQVCRTRCCQEHWLVELGNADKQSVAACEADEMKALKLGNKARMALIWGSSRWAIKLRASQGSKDEKGFFTLMGVPMKRSLPCRGGSSGNATEGAPAGGCCQLEVTRLCALTLAWLRPLLLPCGGGLDLGGKRGKSRLCPHTRRDSDIKN